MTEAVEAFREWKKDVDDEWGGDVPWPTEEGYALVVSAFMRGFNRGRRALEVTEEAVEVVAEALFQSEGDLWAFSDDGEERVTWSEFKDKDYFRDNARIALEALSKGGTE